MKPARPYSPVELEDLRRVVAAKWLYGRYRPTSGTQSRQYQVSDYTTCVEELVRTHMIAGHTAATLLDSELPKAA